jgi:2,5-diamino-6-(ribosylamino)-4(3H)-pyrimidinone 5'-phosphate reductase
MSNSDRPITTLFLMESLDGKISTGDKDELDVDKDFRRIKGLKEGLEQYYELEKRTDFVSLNSGRVMAKIGINKRTNEPIKILVDFVILDNNHLNEKGIEFLAKWVKILYLVTSNENHPAFKVKEKFPNIEVIFYKNEVNLVDLLGKLKQEYGVERITIQSGGTLNALWIRQGLIDNVSIVIAPCLVGGTNTQSLVGGESVHKQSDLTQIKALKLVKNKTLKNSYIHLQYKVINQTEIDQK